MPDSGCQEWGGSRDAYGRSALGNGHQSEGDFASMSDDDLIAQIRLAREAGDKDRIKICLGQLAWRRYDIVHARVLNKVPEEYAEDVVQEIMFSAIDASFDGDFIGQFGSLLNTITQRRIADFHSGRPPEHDPLVEENSDDETTWGEVPAVEDFTDARDSLAILEDALGGLSDRHRMVIELSMEGYRGKEVADRVTEVFPDEPEMTEDNVHQIKKRFRKVLERKLFPEDET